MKRVLFGILLKLFVLLILFPSNLLGQGNKLSIQATTPKNMSVCGFDDTSLISVYNISSSVINGVKATVNLPTGVYYIPGSLKATGVSESNISNLNKPIFSCPSLLIGQNFKFRINVIADCDIIPLLSGNNAPQIDLRIDYTGNYDVGSSNPFIPIIPSPGYASITNSSFIGNVGDKFVRKVTITNYGKGPLKEVRLLRINGKDISANPQAGFNNYKNGDTIRTLFIGANFKGVGDKDTLLEQNESITISDTFTINGCAKITTYYEIGWGCGGKICQVTKNNAAVTISGANPNLKVWPSSVDKYCYDGITPNKQTLTITNIGQKEAKRIEFYVFVGTNYANTFIDTNSVYLKRGANGASKRQYLDSASKLYITVDCVNSNITNYMRLRLGTLAPGDTLIVSWDMFRCAGSICGYAFYDINWLYNYNYSNQCNNVTSVGNAWGKVYTYAAGSVSPWVPTDIAANETKDFKFDFTSFYAVPLTKNGKIRIDLVLPVTLDHSISKSDFFIMDGTLSSTWYPDSIAKIGDTLRGYFGNSFKFDLSKAELTVRLKGICSKFSGNATLPVSMSLYYNPDPACNPYVWIRPICISFSTKVHCSSSCNVGMWFKNFDASRSSFGQPDNNNDGIIDASGSLDMTKVRKERLMYGDTFTTVFTGRPKTNSTYRSWRYGYAESFITYGSYVDVIDARLVVIKGQTLQTGNCNTVRVKKILSGGHATFTFDFTVDSIYPKGCLSSAYRYSSNDSIRLIVRYRVSKNLGGTSVQMNFANKFYFGSAANPTSSQIYQCDTFGANMLLYGYYFANCCSDNVVYSNCAEVALSQSWYMGIGPCCQNYAGNNLFPFEFRNFVKLKSVNVHLPAGMKLGRTFFGQYRTNGVNSYEYQYKDTIPPVKGLTKPYVFNMRKYYKDSGGLFYAGDDGVQGFFYYTVQPRCNLPANTPLRIDYDYIFEKQGVLGTGYDTLKTGSYDLFTFNPPSLSLQPAIPIVYAISDTVEWEVRYTNPSSTFNAYNIWLSPKPSPNVKVVQIRDLDADTLIKPSNDIYRAGVLNAGKIRRFKVRAIFNSCEPDSLVLYGSYNCAEYPDDFASYPCAPNSVSLYIEPQNTRLQLSLTDSTNVMDLCASNKMTLQVENIQSVTAFNTKIRITLPIGMQVIANSSLLKYPISASPISIGKPVLVSGTTYEWDLPKLSSNVSKGFIGTVDTNKNKMEIVFRVTTNCDYASGSFVSARAVANIKCGDPIPIVPAFSNPQDIKGVTRPYYTLVKSWADSLLPCQKPMYIKSRVIYLGPGNSGLKDRIEIFLPNGVSLDTSYWNAVRNAPQKDSITISNFNGANLLSWKMPAGIVPGDSMEFDIRVTGENAKLTCGPADVITRSVVVQPVICVSTNLPCDIKVITGGELANPWVDKGNILLDFPTISSKLISSDSEAIALKYRIKNTGRNIDYSSPIIIRYHFDRNNSGKWDSNDDLLATDTFIRVLKGDSFFWVSRAFNIPSGVSCGILAVVDSAACACLFGQKLFPVPTLKNAGPDTAFCSASTYRPGTFNVKSFAYLWNDATVLDSIRKPKPLFIAFNQTGIAEKHELILTTSRGFCSTKDTVNITIYPLPKLKVTTPDTFICEKRSVMLISTTNGGNGANKYSWIPSTGLVNSFAAKTLASPVITTNYKLKVTDSKGCSATDSANIGVYPFPKTWFTWPVTCQGNSVTITDSSTISAGSIVLQVWKTPFNDTFGTNSIVVNHNTASTMPVTLITESDIGCADTLIRLVDVKANPVAGFNVPYACQKDSSRFQNISAVDSGYIKSFYWNFGDGNQSNLANPIHVYSTYLDYNVVHAVTTENGCTDTAYGMARVFPLPKANFTVNSPCEHDTVRFTNTSQFYGDTLSNWLWNFGLGGSSTQANPVLYADTFGAYNHLLRVETIHGCIDTQSLTSPVFALPKANFTTSNHCLGFVSTFTNTSAIAQGTVSKYFWQTGNGSLGSAKDLNFTYTTAGTYVPKLRVESNKGCQDSVSGSITIWPLAKPVFVGLSHCFTEQFSATSSVWGGGTPVVWKWHLGTGDSLQSQNITYNYFAPGSYMVKLSVTSDRGCVKDTSANIVVYPLPVVGITNSVPCNDDSVVLKGSATIASGSIQSYLWNLSDNTSYPGKNITKTFASAGNQKATLIASSNFGCMDSAQAFFRTNPQVLVDFNVADVCLDEPSFFTNLSTSTETITRYAWKFGDGRTSTLKDPTITYKKAGVFSVELLIETITGCTYTLTKTTNVNPKPIPGFTVDPMAGTIVDPNITFTDISNGADTMWYKLSDGFTYNQRNFTHNFPDSGRFTIWQIAKTNFDCYDSISEDLVIHYMYTLFVPNTFTPNLDTKNEKFGPGGLGISWYEMKIFSRWGEMVYSTENSQPWDGLINGKPASEGVYAVHINIRDYKKRRHTFNGTVTILR